MLQYTQENDTYKFNSPERIYTIITTVATASITKNILLIALPVEIVIINDTSP